MSVRNEDNGEWPGIQGIVNHGQSSDHRVVAFDTGSNLFFAGYFRATECSTPLFLREAYRNLIVPCPVFNCWEIHVLLTDISTQIHCMSQNPEEKLFSEFPPVTVAEWEELIRKDLKGADYEKKLTWLTPEGIRLRPYYTAEDIKQLSGNIPFGGRTRNRGWLVRQDIAVEDPAAANAKAIDCLMKGASSIGFILDDKSAHTDAGLEILLRDVCLASAEINFITTNPAATLPGILEKVNASGGGSLTDIHGSIEYDPLGMLFTTGRFPGNDESRCFDNATLLVENASRLQNFTVLNVHAPVFHDSGGSAVQELAFAMASAAQYLERLTDKGISADKAAQKIRFTFSAGNNYFMEIAKFRAARYLWSKVLEAWDADPAISASMFIHSVTSRWNKTLYDPYVNMLRTTTEAMAAILGGADSLTVGPFDEVSSADGTAFSTRVARNAQLVIREEAYFDRVADPAAGSYYMESLTASLVGHSWDLFLETVDAGGITRAFTNGWVQDRIEETARMRDQSLASRQHVLVGTNQFPDPFERVTDSKGQIMRDWAEREEIKGPGRPLRLYRGAEAFEDIRLKTEKSAETPSVSLLLYGNPVMRKARAGFASGFFGCAGFRIIDHPAFSDPEEGVKAALQSKASMVVICSSDEEYPVIVPAIADALQDRATLVVAGYPKESLEMLKSHGVKHFIHIRSNILETLRQFQAELGIQ
jgi:methylmalonyl-CoA mutase